MSIILASGNSTCPGCTQAFLGKLPSRPNYEHPFWKDIWGSVWPSGATASPSNDVNTCNSTDVSSFIFKKRWQLQHPQITAFSALPYLSVHTCKSTETLTAVFNRAHGFLSNKMSGCDLPYFTSAILPFNLITAKYQVLTILMLCSISYWIRNNKTGLNLWFMVNCLNESQSHSGRHLVITDLTDDRLFSCPFPSHRSRNINEGQVHLHFKSLFQTI